MLNRVAGKFELKTSGDGQTFFHLKAGNGEVILTGETYATKQAALDGVESVRKHAQVDTQFIRKIAGNGQPYFFLKASNGQSLGSSEMYSGAAVLENAIASVKKNAREAKVDDQTATA